MNIEALFIRFSGSPYPPINTDTQESPRVYIMVRYLDLLTKFRKRARIYSCAFYTLRVSISIGSLIVPALLSLNQTNYFVFWIIWVLSLLVSMSNSVVSIFKIDKKYYILNSVYKKLESEGWQFINLTGNYYSAPEIGHDSQIQTFAYRLEKISMQQAEEEYRKNQDQIIQPLSTQDTYLPHSFIQKQKSQQEVNAGIQSNSNKKTQAQQQTAKTTVIEIAKERTVDESTN